MFNKNEKKIWLEKYLDAKKKGNEAARVEAYNKLIEIIGRPLNDKDLR